MFGALLLGVALLYWRTAISRAWMFWAAFILTRPLGATLGDFLDKPLDHGGLALSRLAASIVLLAAMGIGLVLVPQRAAMGDRAH